MGRSLNPLKDWRAYRKMKQVISDFKPDIVHTHAAKPGAIGRMAAASQHVKGIVHTYHGHVFHSYFSNFKTRIFIKIERYLGKKSDAIIAISEEQFKELALQYKIAPPEKFRIIPLGLDLDKFTIDIEEKRKQFRNEFNVSDDTVVITITGRLVPVKNHQLFLEGLKYVLDHSQKKIKAFIVGDGETRKDLEEKAKQLNIEPVFTSWRSDIDHINAGSDIIALTSFNEGTPVSLIEAHAAGKPVVSTRVGGIGSIVEEDVSGLLSAVDDKQGFANNLLRMVNDDDLRRRMGAVAGERIRQQYSYHRLVKDMSQLYNDILATKK